jgi:hypothetical protein
MRALKTTEVLSVATTFIVRRSLVTLVKTGLFSNAAFTVAWIGEPTPLFPPAIALPKRP